MLPTDTVYGVGADAFTPAAVAALLAAKGRGRHKPPPVLIGEVMTMDALATNVSADARALAQGFWPGPSPHPHRATEPHVDLGDPARSRAGPDHPCALALLKQTGPLAVSSANRLGGSRASSAPGPPSNWGLDPCVSRCGFHSARSLNHRRLHGRDSAILRAGAIGIDDLRAIVPKIADSSETKPDAGENGAAASEEQGNDGEANAE